MAECLSDGNDARVQLLKGAKEQTSGLADVVQYQASFTLIRSKCLYHRQCRAVLSNLKLSPGEKAKQAGSEAWDIICR